MITGAFGYITSTTSASGPRRSRGIRLETKRAYLRTTASPAVSSDRYTSHERKRLWTYTSRGTTCLHGDLLFKVSDEFLASDYTAHFFSPCPWHLLHLTCPTGSITRHDIDSPPVSEHMISIYKYVDIFMPSTAYQTFNSPLCLLLIVALTFYLLMGTP